MTAVYKWEKWNALIGDMEVQPFMATEQYIKASRGKMLCESMRYVTSAEVDTQGRYYPKEANG